MSDNIIQLNENLIKDNLKNPLFIKQNCSLQAAILY